MSGWQWVAGWPRGGGQVSSGINLRLPAAILSTYLPGLTDVDIRAACPISGSSDSSALTPVATSVQWGYTNLFGELSYGHVGFRAVSIRQNAYIEAATLHMNITAVGAAWPGGKLRAKKSAPQNVMAGNGNAGYEWVGGAVGTLTTAYAQIPATGALTPGLQAYDVRAIIEEVMGAEAWDEADSLVQFVCIPDGPCTTTAHAITVRKNVGGVADFGLDIAAYQSDGNWENPRLHEAIRALHFMPLSPADMAAHADSYIAVWTPYTEDGDRERMEIGLNAPGQPGLAGATYAPGDFTSINTPTRPARSKFAGYFELPHTKWPAKDGEDFSLNLVGRYTLGSAAISTLFDVPCWKGNFQKRSYMLTTVTEWSDLATGLACRWDLWNFAQYFSQWGIFLDQSAAGELSWVFGLGGAPIDNAKTFAVNMDLAALVPKAAGRTMSQTMVWSHVDKTWRAKVVVRSADGEVLWSRNSVWQHLGDVPETAGFTEMLGIGLAGTYYGTGLFEVRADLRDTWETLSDNMTRMWSAGIKSIDPRLMV